MKRTAHSGSIGKYTIEAILGHGGMATVYRAIMPDTGRILALKMLNPAETLSTFLDESTLREIFTSEVS
ncbi:MAG: hypothetical protein M8357_05080, partial [Desulfobulbaceae bacterium]|nr:hypothetical protein [Desulfobulbaceae bacterium]